MGELRTIQVANGHITYELERKKVKNINLRIYPDGRIRVSARPGISAIVVDNFVRSKANYIEKAARAVAKRKAEIQANPFGDGEIYTDHQVFDQFSAILEELYPLLEPMNVAKPSLKIRRMRGCWGNCRPKEGRITINRRLIAAPVDCQRYVMMHELCHLVHANHSKKFYDLLASFMPDWKERKERLERAGIPLGAEKTGFMVETKIDPPYGIRYN